MFGKLEKLSKMCVFDSFNAKILAMTLAYLTNTQVCLCFQLESTLFPDLLRATVTERAVEARLGISRPVK